MKDPNKNKKSIKDPFFENLKKCDFYLKKYKKYKRS